MLLFEATLSRLFYWGWLFCQYQHSAEVPSWDDFSGLRRTVNTIADDLNFFFTNLDSLNIKHLTADVIDAGTLNADLVTIRSDLNNGAYIELSGSGMQIFDGTKTVFNADIDGNLTVTSALIQSSSGFPRVVMDPSSDLFGAYFTASTYIQMFPNYLGNTPVINFHNSSSDFYVGYFSAQNKFAITHQGGADMEISTTTGDIFLNTNSGNLWTPQWANIINQVSNHTLQEDLDAKATKGIATSSVTAGSHNHGIADGTQLMKGDGTTVTWSSYSGFTHSHTQM